LEDRKNKAEKNGASTKVLENNPLDNNTKNKDLLQKETRRIEDTEKASKELSEASKKISEKLEQMKQMYNKSKTK